MYLTQLAINQLIKLNIKNFYFIILKTIHSTKGF